MYDLYIGNKNYSSWSLRPWVLMRELDIPFREILVPFGGSKQSGVGRESIVDTVAEMSEEKTIVINNAL